MKNSCAITVTDKACKRRLLSGVGAGVQPTVRLLSGLMMFRRRSVRVSPPARVFLLSEPVFQNVGAVGVQRGR